MLFSILAEMIKTIPIGNNLTKLLLIGCTEVTNGISTLSVYHCENNIKYLLAIFFLSLNGVSGLFQTASILCSTDLSMKQYLKEKALLVILILLFACLF